MKFCVVPLNMPVKQSTQLAILRTCHVIVFVSDCGRDPAAPMGATSAAVVGGGVREKRMKIISLGAATANIIWRHLA